MSKRKNVSDAIKRTLATLAPERLTTDTTVRLVASPASAEGVEASRPTFEILAYSGGRIRPSWVYGGDVVIDLAGLRAAEPIAVLLDHAHTSIVGQSTGVEIARESITVRGVVTGDIDDADDPAGKVVLHARNGFQWKASIGVMPGRIEEVRAGDTVDVNGNSFGGPLFVIRSGVLDEVSFLSIGADKSARAKMAASAAKGTPMDFHEWIKARGFNPSTLDDAQRDTLLKAFQAEQAALKAASVNAGGNGNANGNGNGNGHANELDDVLAPVRLKQQRREALKACIAKFADSHPNQFEAVELGGRCALTEDWTPERLELHYFRELGSSPINNAPRSGAGVEDARVVEAAICLTGKLSNPDRHYTPEILDKAERRFRRGVGLRQLLNIAARGNGHGGVDGHDIGELLHAAFPSRERMHAASGPSIFDISGILSNVANKFIVQYFMGVDNGWSQIAGRGNLPDFKQTSFYSLTGDMQYEEVAPGGELKHGTLGETTYANQAKTYGKMFAIDRRDIINDDLNAFMQVSRRLGRGGALKLNDVFWSKFLDNAAFFMAGNGNYLTGATSAFSLTSLETAEAAFMKMVDPNGKPMGVLPRWLVVPPELKRSALSIMNSTEIRITPDTTTTGESRKGYGTRNTFDGEFGVASSPYMSNSAYPGSSTTAWYLLADPLDVPVIQIGFLNGVERPTIEQAMADFDTLGIKMRGFWDFGVALQEPRGGIKVKGVV